MTCYRIASLGLMGIVVVAAYAQWTPPFGVPAFHAHAPTQAESLPKLFSYTKLTGEDRAHSYQVEAFKKAALIPGVLYQLPCYCYCDRREGHASVHSCFETSHAAGCKECMKEALYAYAMTMKHATPAQIRAGLKRGEFRNVELIDKTP
jgi:hypothetical protein